MTEYHDGQSPGMSSHRITRRAAMIRAVGSGAGLAGAAYLLRSSISASELGVPMTQATPVSSESPTVVLVHGAFADASGWAGVITELQSLELPSWRLQIRFAASPRTQPTLLA